MHRIRTRALSASVVVAVTVLSACTTSGAWQQAEPSPSDGIRLQPSRSVAAPVSPSPPPDVARISVQPSDAPWTAAIDAAIAGRDVSVAVGVDDRIVHSHLGRVARVPASNQKLLTSMAALATWGPSFRFPTTAMAKAPFTDGVVRGDLWIVGSGDPGVSAASMARLASRLHAAGLTRVRGAVVGDTSAFTREWWAPGWVPGLSRSYVSRATSLAFDGNDGPGSPEEHAAAALTTALESRGVEVAGAPRAAALDAGAPGLSEGATDLTPLARISSPPLRDLLTTQNHGSVNFYAEMLLKALGAHATDTPGSTADGAVVVERWAEGWGVEAQVRDGSGLSHADRISTQGVVSLLLLALREPWASVLVGSLPGPGDGTVGDRLVGVPVRAKTGTLFETPVSSLGGYVTDANGATVAFSVMSRGLDKTVAASIEDEIVRILAAADIN
jgi:D-alanyl-D-alanine carboxypeptidase/D-alanyl-D-alanine-endopeptidase (penicillin-binding protein 4)